MGDLSGRRVTTDDYRHIQLEQTQSTNADCLQKAKEGDPGLLWITAGRQLGGRGRRGRPWISEPGNLYASLLIINAAPMEALSALPLAVAVAVRQAIAAVLPPLALPVEVKWPNDIMIGRKKCCGILLEGEKLPNGDHALVIGCGINIAHKPEQTLYPTTCLRDEGASVTPDEVFTHLFKNMAEVIALWDRGNGTGQVVDMWRSHAMGLGEAITVNLADRSLSGTFGGIDQTGILQLITATGAIVPIAAGDIFFS